MEKIKLQITSKLYFLYFESKLRTATSNVLQTALPFRFMYNPLKAKRCDVGSEIIIHHLEKLELIFKYTIFISLEDEQGKKGKQLDFCNPH